MGKIHDDYSTDKGAGELDIHTVFENLNNYQEVVLRKVKDKTTIDRNRSFSIVK